VLDDVGFSAMEPFGGLIETPNIGRIAQQGLRYTNFHTTALCSPTRSCLLTGPGTRCRPKNRGCPPGWPRCTPASSATPTIADPLVVPWPRGFSSTAETRHQYTHAVEIVLTLFECLGVELPNVVNGYTQKPLEGTSFRYSFNDQGAATQKGTQF
jgi:arylsulfatase A-like enzyme